LKVENKLFSSCLVSESFVEFTRKLIIEEEFKMSGF